MAGRKTPKDSKTDSNGVLCITEKWIRDHLNLQKDTLDDVRSLSLPGSYYEKITHLGRSLVGFACLKHLDLSRNALESLEGLDHLKYLESLNLYFNNIASLSELFRLRHNRKLKDLDVRLNPVIKTEPDYRLFLVHMLVNLRNLDDHCVRDSDRRAALLHFNSEQAHLFNNGTDYDTSSQEQGHSDSMKHLSSRKELVKSLATRPTRLDNDTDELLDLIYRRDHADMGRQLGSPLTHHSPPSHHHTPHSLPSQHHTPRNSSSHHHTTHSPPSHHHMPHSTAGGERQGIELFTPVPTGHGTSSKPQLVDQERVAAALGDLLGFMQWFVDGDLGLLQQDSEFKEKFGDWLRAHLPPLSTPSQPHTSQVSQASQTQKTRHTQKLQESIKDLQQQLETVSGAAEHKDTEIAQLKSIPDRPTLSHLQTQLEASESKVSILTQQLAESHGRLEELVIQHQLSEESLRQQLQQAARENVETQETLCALREENKSLRTTLDQAPPTNTLHTLTKQINDLERERDDLRVELDEEMGRQCQEAETTAQLQRLVVMLQESHRSLVATNSHLLQELDESKLRHSQEVAQMNMNYEHLRKTISVYTSTCVTDK